MMNQCNTTSMVGLPPSWSVVKLGEICDGVAQVDPKANPDEEFTYLEIASIDNSRQVITEPTQHLGKDAPSRARQLVRTGDVLFSTVRTYLKNIAYVDERFDGQVASTGFCVIRPFQLIEPKYLYYLVMSDAFLEPLNRMQRGTSYPAVRDVDVMEQSVPLPPVPEQQRIVAKIEELLSNLDAGALALQTAMDLVKKYRSSLIKAAIEGELSREWREANQAKIAPASELHAQLLEERRARWEAQELAKFEASGQKPKNDKWKAKYKEPAQLDTSLPELPLGWTWASMEQLSWASGYGTSEKCDYDYSGPPVLRIPNIAKGQLDLTNLKFAGEGLAIDDHAALQAGDMLIIRTNGSKNLIGRSAVVETDIQSGMYFASYLIRYRLLGLEHALPTWIGSIWHSHRIRSWIESVAATSAGQYNVSMGTLNQLPVELPPAAEQDVILAELERRLSVAAEIEGTLQEELQRAERLRQSVLKQAFSGALVSQDPADEPAPQLLERIRELKSQNQPAPAKRGRKAKKEEVAHV